MAIEQGLLFHMDKNIMILFKDLNLNVGNVLKRAKLPAGMFNQEKISLTTEQYFALWSGIETEMNDPFLPLKIGETFRMEHFDPTLFAATCSPNLAIALERISVFKRLLCPMELKINQNDNKLKLEIRWLIDNINPPRQYVLTEIVFFITIARNCTRENIIPLEITAPIDFPTQNEYKEFFGVTPKKGKELAITFSMEDAMLPFLTQNDKMWNYFEPDLKRRLTELDSSASIIEKVRSALIELLPSGSSSIGSVSEKLMLSPRTLQRRLKEENASFQAVLKKTRERLAAHYRKNHDFSAGEIALLLGFKNTNSFYRAIKVQNINS
jgi:AraC-like DNA-binding protein